MVSADDKIHPSSSNFTGTKYQIGLTFMGTRYCELIFTQWILIFVSSVKPWNLDHNERYNKQEKSFVSKPYASHFLSINENGHFKDNKWKKQCQYQGN